MGGRLCYCVCAFLTLVAGAPDTPNTWLRPQPQQTLHGLMVSVEEQLRTFEFTRWEATLKQLEQRIESLESSNRRLDTTFQDRLDKLERNLNSKELKDELMVEKLSHKVRDVLDSSYDRYNRRLGYAEERLEMALKKVQMSLETTLTRVEKNQEDVQAEVVEAVTILEDLKGQTTTTEVKLNSTHKAIQQHIQSLMTPNNEELQRISGTLENLGSRLNNSLGGYNSQSDGPNVGDVVTTFRKEINAEGTKFVGKVNIMYNDLWRRIVSVETLVKDLTRLKNATHREVLEEIRSMVLSDHKDSTGDSQENFMEVALDALERKLQRKLADLSRKVDDRMDSLSAGQSLMMDNCFDEGVCRGLESRLSQVLERIFEVVSDKIDGYSNRTFDLNNLILEMMELVKNQHSQLIRTVMHNTNMVVTLAKESSDTDKKMHSSILQLAEKTDYNFQELHDEFQEISNTGGKVCLDTDKTIEDIIDNQKPSELPQKNLTEIVVVTTLNSTQPENNSTKKYQDVGVLKILTDDVQPLGDNGNSNNPKLSRLEFNSVQHADSSTMQILSLISPNLTRSQLESLLMFLNNSVNLENVEAIIQNTEAELDEDMSAEASSLEIFDTYLSNKTNADDDNLDTLKSRTKEKSFMETSNELENTDEANNDLDHLDLSEIVISQNITNLAENGSSLNTDRNETNLLDLPDDLKEQLQAYIILRKIKQEHLNISHLWEKTEKTVNKSEVIPTKVLVPVLQKLCYGVENVHDLSTEFINDAMRTRLILIRQTINNDINLYEKIENVCNTMTESLPIQNDRKVTLPGD